jgi:hypothetical protein
MSNSISSGPAKLVNYESTRKFYFLLLARYGFYGKEQDEITAEVRARVKKRLGTDDDACWPSVPYCYSQGRIMGYETWLASLDKDEQEAEIEATRQRYSVYWTIHISEFRDLMRERKDLVPEGRHSGMEPSGRQRDRDYDYGL